MANPIHLLVTATAGKPPFPDADLSVEEYKTEVSEASHGLLGARGYGRFAPSAPTFMLAASPGGLEAKHLSRRGQAAALGLLFTGLLVGMLLFLEILNAEASSDNRGPVAIVALSTILACLWAAVLPGRALLFALTSRGPGWPVQVVSASFGVLHHALDLRSDVGPVTVRVVGRRKRLEAALRLAGQSPPAAETFHQGPWA